MYGIVGFARPPHVQMAGFAEAAAQRRGRLRAGARAGDGEHRAADRLGQGAHLRAHASRRSARRADIRRRCRRRPATMCGARRAVEERRASARRACASRSGVTALSGAVISMRRGWSGQAEMRARHDQVEGVDGFAAAATELDEACPSPALLADPARHRCGAPAGRDHQIGPRRRERVRSAPVLSRACWRRARGC